MIGRGAGGTPTRGVLRLPNTAQTRVFTASIALIGMAACGGRNIGLDGGLDEGTGSGTTTEISTGPDDTTGDWDTDSDGDSGDSTTSTSTSTSTSTTGPACAEPDEPDPACEGVCGNGELDSCEICGRAAAAPSNEPIKFDVGEPCQWMVEECDGAQLADETCEALGYSGGELACTTACRFDVELCSVCTLGGSIVACAEPEVDDYQARKIAVGSQADRIGAAWVDGESWDGTAGVHFATFDEDLQLLDERDCFGPGDATSVALTSSPSGWILAAFGYDSIEIHPLNLQGQPRGEVEVIAGRTDFPVAIPRPGDGPLLVYVDSGQLMASLVDDDGMVAWTSQVLDDVYDDPGGGTFADDRFFVSKRGPAGVAIVELDLMGDVQTTKAPFGTKTESGDIDWAGNELRATWADFGGTGKLFWARLSPELDIIAGPVELGSIPDQFNRSPIHAVGDDSWILLGGYSGIVGFADRLSAVRVGGDGSIIKAEEDLMTAPIGTPSYAVTPFAGDFVAAWARYDGAGIALSRVTP